MRRVIVFLSMVLCWAPWLRAYAADQYVDVTAGYSRAEFDSGQKSRLWQLQASYGGISGRFDYGLTIPYLLLDDGYDEYTGLGDVIMRAGLNLLGAYPAKDTLNASMAVKFPTADESKGLGTGETDLGGFLTYMHHFSKLSVSLLGGYIVTGDSSTQAYKDILVYGAGVSRIVNRWNIYFSLDGRQQAYTSGTDPLELTGGFFYQLEPARFIKLEAYVGLNNGSPDDGISLGMVNWF